MSEAELYLIRQRMLRAAAKAGRGELAIPLPIGTFVALSGEVVGDPDEQAACGPPDLRYLCPGRGP